MCMPKVQAHPWVQQFYPPLTIKGRWTVSTLWQHPGWFSSDKGTFSGSDLVHNTMIWSLFQCKAQSGIVWFYRSGPLFITNRAACSFYLLTSPTWSVSSMLRTRLNFYINVSLLFLGSILPGSEDHWEKMPLMQSRSYPPSHVCSSLDCNSQILYLSALATAYQPFMPLQKADIFWSWHAAAIQSQRASLSCSREVSHLQHTAVWLS